MAVNMSTISGNQYGSCFVAYSERKKQSELSGQVVHLNKVNARGAAVVDHIKTLEAEAIHILREVAAEFERPVLLFSGGKDSICLLRLAEKAFRPGKFPFPLLHVDTGHNFTEVIEFRDRIVRRLNERLIVASVDEMLANGQIRQTPGEISRNRLQIPALLSAINAHKFDAAIGGARRDEEKSRGQGAYILLPQCFRTVGTAQPAPGTLEHL